MEKPGSGRLPVWPQDIIQAPGTIGADFDAKVDVARAQLWRGVVVNMAVQVEHSGRQGDNRAV